MAVTARKRIRERKESESLENEESQCIHSLLILLLLHNLSQTKDGRNVVSIARDHYETSNASIARQHQTR